MNSLKRAFKIFAVAIMSVAVAFGVAACGDNGGNTGGTGGGGTGSGSGSGSGEVPGGDPTVVIPTTPAGAVKITAAAGDLESAYVIWDKVSGAMGYNVYYKIDGGSFVQLDEPLVREYPNYFRADAVGLKAGTYTMKVVPTGGANLTEDESKAATASSIAVSAHDRSGYAFVNGTSSGAYNEDGTLKADATVVYVTDVNKNSVTATLSTGTFTGIQNILYGVKKATSPLAIRLIGNITAPTLDTYGFNTNTNTLLIKENVSGITLEGIGSDATANGWTLRLVSTSNVEVRNIGVMNTKASEPDGISIEKGNHIWVHNCDIFYGGAGGDSDQAKGDGALDTKLASYVTHSYNHFWDSGKSNLQGMKSETVANYITYHHNWYDHSDSRHPRIRTCTVHVYNNYFDGNSKYGVGVTTGSSTFVENNYFRSTATMRPMMSSGQGTDAQGEGTFSGESGGMIKAYGNTFDCSAANLKLITQNDTSDKTNLDCYLATSRNEQVPSEYKTKSGGTTYSNFDTAADFYEYQVDTAEQAKANVEKYAGRVGGGDFKWEFDDATEDSNYSIITALKTALTNYTCPLVKVAGITVGSGSTGGDSTGDGSTEGDTTGGNTTGGATENQPIDGEIVYIPTTSGSGFTIVADIKSNAAIVVAGVDIPAKAAIKINGTCNITFTTTARMKLYLYVENVKTVNVDGTALTPVSEGGYYVVSVELAAGDHQIIKGGGENTLYLIKLIPV